MRIASTPFKVLVLALCVAAIACSKDKDKVTPCSENFSFWSEISNEVNALGNASSVYVQNPTTENCEAYRSAANDYLDAARDLEDCANKAGQRDDYLQAIDEAQTSIDQIQC